MPDIALLADALADAESSARPIAQLSDSTSLSLSDAYDVQMFGVRRRVRAGDPVVGLKLGFTSIEKARQMGVHDVILGVLTASRDLGAGSSVSLGSMIHPRIEPELAFKLGPDVAALDLTDPRVDLLDHVTHVAAAVELIDSRYRDFRFTVEDVVADNTSAARFQVGEWVPFDTVRDRVGDLSVTLCASGEEVRSGSTHAILGDPLEAVRAVQRLAVRYGHRLPASAVILAGAATAAVPMAAATVYEATVEGVGAVMVQAEV